MSSVSENILDFMDPQEEYERVLSQLERATSPLPQKFRLLDYVCVKPDAFPGAAENWRGCLLQVRGVRVSDRKPGCVAYSLRWIGSVEWVAEEDWLSEEPPCIGLDPDTEPCPYCGAWLSDPCKLDKRRTG